MATAAQIRANQENSKKSTGPKDTSRTRLNGLTHGLCSEQVTLPGENPADFDAWRDGWFGDWRPMTHTRAVLVERADVEGGAADPPLRDGPREVAPLGAAATDGPGEVRRRPVGRARARCGPPGRSGARARGGRRRPGRSG
jgi:hypothetical protein